MPIKIILKKVILKLASILIKLGYFVYTSPNEKRVILWSEDKGDRTHRLNYDLHENSLVFDLGGYEGQWASDMFSMYCCYIHIFEPVDKFARRIEKRFSKNDKVFIYQHGLSNQNQSVQIFIDEDSSSTFQAKVLSEEIRLVKAIDFMKEFNFHHIDLMKINIEGGEYELLEHLLDSGFIQNINNIQVQFHDFIPNATERMMKIQCELEKTHFLTYQYPFVWENWQKK